MKYIRCLILIIFIHTIYKSSNAQINIGVEGSPSLIFLRGNDILNDFHKPTLGFSGGLFFQYNLKNVFSLHTNLAFERKGSLATVQTTDYNANLTGEMNVRSDYDYLTLPLLIRATFGDKIKYYVNAGPYLGYLIKSKSVSKENNSSKIIVDFTDNMKRFDAGLSAGLGLSYPMNEKIAFSLELRNNLGLCNISAKHISNNETIKTNSTNFLFGLAYKLGDKILDTK